MTEPELELGSDRADRERRMLAEIAERYPHWAVTRTFGGWDCAPAGTVVIRTITLEAMLRHLAEQEGDGS